MGYVTTVVASRIFARLVFPLVKQGRYSGAASFQPMHAVVPKFTELHQQAAPAGLGAREWSVSPWHGMPTALGKSKRFLN